ncbi:unnamed protein product (macronuclear) [Paramecium tetraurelia]|uniref:Casein kinase I n=1 Tax=Paramecium tetraurelia TaxID=5888 RepID=A0BGR0_PARTE|nr:uncharacterized protein GSPATT00028762001 [Paramecium tetraurelia]CAK57727.1 unnamed protein product [Paramecium tetraurelia]|eukprot:XP_001425125.1 hypothetical protein (macronuclear) [Paramecium tetraurelia strain d4-2]
MRKQECIAILRQSQQNEIIPELQFLLRLKDTNCASILVKHGDQVINGQKYHYQILQRHGPSIKLVYHYLSKSLPLPLLCLIAIQTLTCLEAIHRNQIVHRNIRPKKLLLSTSGNEILLCDFKFASKFKLQQGSICCLENHNSNSSKLFLNKYSSINQHLNQFPTPKDDLESLAYILLVYATNSSIFKIKADNKGLKLKKLENIKLSMVPEIAFKSAPIEFIHFLNLIKTSNANDYPQEYEKFKSLFRKIIQAKGYNEKDLQYTLFHMQFQESHSQQQKVQASRFKKISNRKESSEQEAMDDEIVLQNQSQNLQDHNHIKAYLVLIHIDLNLKLKS